MPTMLRALLLAGACNPGMAMLVRHYVPALTNYRSPWDQKNYARSDTLVAVDAKLVNNRSVQHWSQNMMKAVCGSCKKEVEEVKKLHVRVDGAFSDRVTCCCCPHCCIIFSCQPDIKSIEKAAEAAIEAAFVRRAKF